MQGPCYRRTVRCLIVDHETNQVYYGDNSCQYQQDYCPRGDAPSEQGYWLCKAVCGQKGHAEAIAASKVPERLRDATAYVLGHSFVCSDCEAKLNAIGVPSYRIVIQDSNEGGACHGGVA